MYIIPGYTYNSTNAKVQRAKACEFADVAVVSSTDLLALCDVCGNHVKAGVAHIISRGHARAQTYS